MFHDSGVIAIMSVFDDRVKELSKHLEAPANKVCSVGLFQEVRSLLWQLMSYDIDGLELHLYNKDNHQLYDKESTVTGLMGKKDCSNHTFIQVLHSV